MFLKPNLEEEFYYLFRVAVFHGTDLADTMGYSVRLGFARLWFCGNVFVGFFCHFFVIAKCIPHCIPRSH